MEPTPKSYSLEKAINAFLGADRSETIRNNQCVPPPIGCGKKINPETEFRDEVSRREFQISGLCSTCQNKIFEK
jgi:hypothetical protein